MIKIKNNKIISKNYSLEFKDKIFEAVEYNGRLVIVFDSDEDEGFDNVYCYTIEKQFLWRIKPAPENIGGTIRTPYVGVDMIDGICRVIDFWGRRFIIDIVSGEILSKDIVR